MSDAVIVVVGSGPYQVELHNEVSGVHTTEHVATWSIPTDLDIGDAPAVIAGSIAENIHEFVANEATSPAFVQIGQYLGRLLLPENGPRAAWRALNATQTRLEIESSELRAIPWEMIRCGNEALFLSNESTSMRAQPYEEPPAHWSLPVRLLVLEGERSTAIDTVTEIRAIKRALATSGGWVEAEFLSMPDAKQFRDAYARFAPHIFHFIGHCDEWVDTRESALWVGPPDDQWPISATAIADLFKPAPRLAVLNACRTAEELTHSNALTDAFLQSGSAAVVGMQGNILGTAAAMFGGELYRALIEGAGIDVAVARARMEIYTHNGVTGARDWFLPNLTLRAVPCGVLPEIRKDECQQVIKSISTFVDRVEERQRLASGADPDVDARAQRLLLVTGGRETGKTSLVSWLLRRCAIRARRVKYVDLEGTDNLGFLQALYRIRKALDPAPGAHPDGEAPFDRFNHDLGYYAIGQFPEETENGLTTLAEPPEPETLQNPPPGLVEHLFRSFRDGLNAYCATEPFVLTLDHVEKVSSYDFKDQVLPHLILPALDGDIPGVRLVVVLTADKINDDHWPPERRGLQIHVDDFERDLFMPLAEETYLACGKDIPDYFQVLFENVLKTIPAGRVKPRGLRRVAEAARGTLVS